MCDGFHRIIPFHLSKLLQPIEIYTALKGACYDLTIVKLQSHTQYNGKDCMLR